MGRKREQRRLFILPHEAAVAVDVGTEYGGEFAFHIATQVSRELTSVPPCANRRNAAVLSVPAKIEGSSDTSLPERIRG